MCPLAHVYIQIFAVCVGLLFEFLVEQVNEMQAGDFVVFHTNYTWHTALAGMLKRPKTAPQCRYARVVSFSIVAFGTATILCRAHRIVTARRCGCRCVLYLHDPLNPHDRHSLEFRFVPVFSRRSQVPSADDQAKVRDEL